MLLFSGIDENDLSQIYEIRRMDAILRQNEVPAEENIDLIFPHDAFHIGLDSLKGSADPYMEYSGVRIIEADNHSFNFVYDIHKGFEGYGPQMFKDKKFIAVYEKAFEALTSVAAEQSEFVVRTLGVPSVYIEALWLHNEDNKALDRFLMLRSVSLLPEPRFYNREEFLDILRRKAREMSEGNDEQRNENDDEVSGLETQPV